MKKTRRFLIAFLALLCLGLLTAGALAAEEPVLDGAVVSSGNCGADGDNLTWTLYDDGLMVISGTGDMENYLGGRAPWHFDRTDILCIEIESGVTSIGENTFRSCSSLMYVTIPESVSSIGEYAFAYSGLTSVTIPESVTSIGEYAFASSGLASLTIEEGVTGIGEYAFHSCNSLASVTIPGSVSHIGSHAFSVCSGLKSVVIGEGVKSLDESAFESCHKLKEITIPLCLTEIEYRAFYGTNIEDVYYGGTVFDWKDVDIGDQSTWFSDYDLHCKPVSLAEAVVKVDNQNYTGEELTPEPVVTLDDQKLVKKKDYTVSYSNNKKAGIAAVTITGTGNYEGTAMGTFKILTGKTSIKAIQNVSTGVKITWYKVTGAKGFEIGRMTEDGEWETLGTTTKSAYTDTNVQSGVKYIYHVRCITKDGSTPVSGYSKAESIKYLAAPTLTEVEKVSKGVKLTWDAVKGASKYAVYRKVSGGSWEYLAATKKTAITDKTTESGIKYFYKVCCAAKDGRTAVSVFSKTKTITFFTPPELYSTVNVKSGVELIWTESWGAEKYAVYRMESGGSWEKLGVTVETMYTDKTAQAGVKYAYKVCCTTKNGSTPVSAFSKSKTIKYFAPPTLKSAKNVKKGIKITWTESTGASKYAVYRKASIGSWEMQGVTAKTAYTDKTAKSGVEYTYMVCCVTKDGSRETSAYSGTKTVTCETKSITITWLGQTLPNGFTDFTGGVFDLEATVYPPNMAVEWYSTDEDVATVDKNGIVTIVGNSGESCYIVAKAGDIKEKVQCIVW